MIIYWSLCILPALAALFNNMSKALGTLALLLFVTFMVIAFRESGGDYFTYNLMYQLIERVDLTEAVAMTDPAYGLVNWLAAKLGLGFYGVNAMCAALFIFAFYHFAKWEPLPLLSLAIAMPYLIIVVVIGYTRQGTAIGFELLALSSLMRQRPLKFLMWLAVAGAFHSSAKVLLPLMYFGLPSQTGWFGRFVAATTVVALGFLVYSQMSETIDAMYETYVESDHYSSQGALIRNIMNLAAALAFLRVRVKWQQQWGNASIFTALSLAAVAIIPFTFIASTAADRIGLYLIPLQVIVFGRLPILCATPESRFLLKSGIISGYVLAFSVWLHLGQFAQALWLPFSSPILGTFG